MVHMTKERRIEHYSNRQKILLVGEGDFSFAACLANSFGHASNIVATSLDSRGEVISKYSRGWKNIRDLEDRGALVIHRVDAHTMNRHRLLQGKCFDRIVFNFPHAGDTHSYRRRAYRERNTCNIERHRHVVSGFLRAARKMMAGDGGEIHVTHKTTYPFDQWRIGEVAEEAGLVLKREVEFSRWNYPGYDNKKAYGRRWDLPFRVGDSSTFVFCLTPSSVWCRLSL